MPSEFHSQVSPDAFGITVQRTPLALGIPRSRLWYGTDIFWNRPILQLLQTFCILSFMAVTSFSAHKGTIEMI